MNLSDLWKGEWSVTPLKHTPVITLRKNNQLLFKIIIGTYPDRDIWVAILCPFCHEGYIITHFLNLNTYYAVKKIPFPNAELEEEYAPYFRIMMLNCGYIPLTHPHMGQHCEECEKKRREQT